MNTVSTQQNPTPLTVMRAHITLDAARLVIASALAEAKRRGWAISVAVVDPAGELVAFERHDAAAGVTPKVALAKAHTAAMLRAPSSVFEDFVNTGKPSFLATPGITPLQGGVPICIDDQVVGAVGISGAPGDEDGQMAAVAITALQA